MTDDPESLSVTFTLSDVVAARRLIENYNGVSVSVPAEDPVRLLVAVTALASFALRAAVAGTNEYLGYEAMTEVAPLDAAVDFIRNQTVSVVRTQATN